MAMDENELLKKIGESITRRRKEKGLTSKELGYMCDIEKPNLIAIEKGRINVTVKTLKKIADALDIEIREFFEFNGNH